MDAVKFSEYLKAKSACQIAKLWASNKSWHEVYNTCHRGDWLIWLYHKSRGYDLRKLTLAKGLCANTVRHIMKDERSLKAVDAAIAFGKGEISIDKLNAVANYAHPAANPATYDANPARYAAAHCAYAAATIGGYTAAADAANAAAADADAANAADARKGNQQMTADIVREVLPFDIWVL